MIAAILERWCSILATCFALICCLTYSTCTGAQEVRTLYPLERGSLKAGDRKYGYVDRTGHFIVPPQFDWGFKFVDGRAQVRIGKKVGYIDEHGQMVVPAIYDFGTAYSDGLAAVALGQVGKDRQWSVIDRVGRVIVPPKYGSIGRVHDGLIIVGSQPSPGQPMRFGAIDTAGRPAIDLVFEGLGAFSEGLAPAKTNGKYGFISKNGELAIPAIYEYANSFTDGLAIVVVKDASGRHKQGVINTHGKYVVQPEYDYVQGFQDGKAIAIERYPEEKFHLFDRTGVRLLADINPRTLCDRNPYDSWHADNLTVRKSADGKCFYADTSGHNRFARTFERAWPFSDGLGIIWVKAEEAFGAGSSKRLFAGVINESGAVVVPPVFDQIWMDTPDMIRVEWKDKKNEYIDRRGELLTFSKADLAKYIEDMRAHFAPIVRDPIRTVVARAADGNYYLSLPKGFCVLDRTNIADARAFEAVRKQATGAKEASKQSESARGLTGGVGQKSEGAEQQVIAGLFAPCDDLRSYRESGGRQELKRLGIAAGLRRGQRDPSASAGIVYISRMMCGMLRARSPNGLRDGLREQTSQKRTERIAEGWRQAINGTPTQLGAIDDQLLGCTSVGLAPDGHGAVAASITTLAFLPEWSITIFRTAAPKSEHELIDLLHQETETINTITQVAMDAMAVEAR